MCNRNEDLTPKPNCRPLKLVAIHLGVRNSSHNEQSLGVAKEICESIFKQPIFSISNQDDNQNLNNTNYQKPASSHDISIGTCANGHSNAEMAVVQLIKSMEDLPGLNCGFGSNLNIDAMVECDASLMCDKRDIWAGVGAISNCKNPILLAKSLYDKIMVPRPLGLIQPNLIVGRGARQWMRNNCPELLVHESKLISAKSLATYQKIKSRYDATLRLTVGKVNDKTDDKQYCDHEMANKAVDASEESHQTIRSSESVGDCQFDTVGAIVIDCEDNFASAVSSGGLILKYKGRVGHCAVPGAGCWAQDSVAVTTTGVGEYITQALLAKNVHDRIQKLRSSVDSVPTGLNIGDLISEIVEECFRDMMRSKSLQHVPNEQKLVGMLSACCIKESQPTISSANEGNIYLSIGLSAPSICIGYMSSEDTDGHSIICNQRAGEIMSKTIKICSS